MSHNPPQAHELEISARATFTLNFGGSLTPPIMTGSFVEL